MSSYRIHAIVMICSLPAVFALTAAREGSAQQASQILRVLREAEAWNCHSLDSGAARIEEGGWRLYYGVVTGRGNPTNPTLGRATCDYGPTPYYTEDIWRTAPSGTGMDDADRTDPAPDWRPATTHLALSSRQFREWCDACNAIPPGNCCPVPTVSAPPPGLDPSALATGFHIGDPAIATGSATGITYLFFNVQSCDDAAALRNTGIAVATSPLPGFVPYTIRKLIDFPRDESGHVLSGNLPGVAPFMWPTVFKDASDGQLYLYYIDSHVVPQCVRVVDDGVGTNFIAVSSQFAPVIENPARPYGFCDKLSVFRSGGSFYAVADNFGDGTSDANNVIWLLGPSASPIGFNWYDRFALITGQDGTWFERVKLPTAVGSDQSGGGERIYFSSSYPENECFSYYRDSAALWRGFNDLPVSRPLFREVTRAVEKAAVPPISASSFGVTDQVTRAMAAEYVVRALSAGAPPPTPVAQRFWDVPLDHPAAAYIDRFAALGITAGCGGGAFCPGYLTDRGQMAVFIVRAVAGWPLAGQPTPPGPPTPTFSDVPVSHPFYYFIEEAYRRGITYGCGGGMFCPDYTVTKEQTATLLTRAFFPLLPADLPPPAPGKN